jgi:2-polyprenyl-6-hydroxyphenyl methylase/3-demethylubiquinone-9 3-methyltransferase
MWAPDHQVVADELVRVCRPGGTIGLINFAAGGLIEKFLAVLDGFAPPPPPWAASPTRWGDERHLRTLFGNRVESLTITPGVDAERVPGGAAGYCAFYRETFGPIAAVFDQLADQPDRAAELDRRFLDFATDANRGEPGGSAELCFEYIVAIGRRR